MGEGRFADRDIDRRAMLRSMAVAGAGAALAGCGVLRGVPHGPGRPRRLRAPGSRPNPRLPECVDTLPQIEHIVVLMMENHSFDDHFGLLGRGDGFRLDRHGRPRDANPDGTGRLYRRIARLAAQPGGERG